MGKKKHTGQAHTCANGMQLDARAPEATNITGQRIKKKQGAGRGEGAHRTIIDENFVSMGTIACTEPHCKHQPLLPPLTSTTCSKCAAYSEAHT